MSLSNEQLTVSLSNVNPVINRCFYTRKSALPDEYQKRVTRCYELEYIPWGEGYIVANGTKYPAEAGTVFFRKPGIETQGFLPYSSYGILLDSIPVDDLPECSVFTQPHAVQALFQDVYKYYLSNDPLDQLRMKADVYNIIYCILKCERFESNPAGQAALRYHADRFEHLKEYIDKNLSRQMTLNELAQECSISPGFLCRLFKQSYNETLFSYINERRITEARRLLIETNRPIKDICVSCGFENESYFYRTFKRKTRLSPAGYRRMHRQPFADGDK